MSKLFLLMGVPGAGKTTWIKKQLKPTDAYISRDDIRFSLLKEDEDYFAHENEVFKIFYRQINSALLDPKIERVFADATHINVKSREKILNKIYTVPEEINIVWIKTPLMTCIEQNALRKGRAEVPIEIIKKMYYNIEEPSKKEKDIDNLYIVDYKYKTIKKISLREENLEGFNF